MLVRPSRPVASFVTGLLAFTFLAVTSALAQARWSALSAPPGRAAHAMAYDVARGQVVVHGGQLPGSVPPRLLGDTWVYDGVTWTDVTSASGPGVRTGHAMAYDFARQRVVLFGGYDGSALLDDTWEWDGAAWTRIPTPAAPTPRSEHALAYDLIRGRTVLFGGVDGLGAQADTWEWDGVAWTNATPAGVSPPPLRRHAMAGDVGRAGVVLFGGTAASGLTADTWLWNGRVWSQVPGIATPPPLDGHALVADIVRQVLVLFGGYGPVGTQGNLAPSDETWELQPTGWRQVTPATAPPRRTLTAAAFDQARARVVLFGGTDTGNALSDAWDWDGTAWTSRSGDPLARSGHAMATDPGGGSVVLFGGWDGIRTMLGDTWLHDGSRWAVGPGGPPPRRFCAMALDPVRGRVVLFGGSDGSVSLADTWEWDGRAWTPVTTSTVPPARQGHALAWDPASNRVLMFGGSGVASTLSDTWAYDGVDWRLLTPANSPTPRARHAMASDRARGRVVLFGGAGAAIFGDTWEWDGASWRAMTPATSPPARLHHAMTFDAARARVVLSGGRGASGILADTWEWDGVDWRAVSVGTAPPNRQSHAMAANPGGDHVLAFGGEDGPVYRSDTWRLAADPTASYESFGNGCAGSTGSVPAIDAEPFSRPWLGDRFTVRASRLPAGWVGAFLFTGFSRTSWGGNALPFDLTPFGMPSCRLLVEIFVSFPMTRTGSDATWAITIPTATSLVGQEFYNQALVLVPGANAAGALVSFARRGLIGQR